MHIDAISTGAANSFGGFKVTSQGTTGIAYDGGSAQTITWNVVGTDVAPINASNVIIYMSTDGGNTWPYTVGTFPNNGSASITVPNPPANTVIGRFKVKAVGNIFFNVNTRNITIRNNPSLPTGVAAISSLNVNDVKVYPVPAHDVLNISTTVPNKLVVAAYSATGQMVWSGNVNGQATVDVSTWARGVYHIRFADAANGESLAKTVVIE